VKQSAAMPACVLRATSKKGRQLLWRKKCTPEKILATPLTLGDLAWGFSNLEMTWLLYCAGAATAVYGVHRWLVTYPFRSEIKLDIDLDVWFVIFCYTCPYVSGMLIIDAWWYLTIVNSQILLISRLLLLWACTETCHNAVHLSLPACVTSPRLKFEV